MYICRTIILFYKSRRGICSLFHGGTNKRTCSVTPAGLLMHQSGIINTRTVLLGWNKQKNFRFWEIVKLMLVSKPKSYRLESLRSSIRNRCIEIATSLFSIVIFCIVNSKHLCGFVLDIFDNGIIFIQTEFFPPFRITFDQI